MQLYLRSRAKEKNERKKLIRILLLEGNYQEEKKMLVKDIYPV